jgi:type I restriction-modification system DNA methylase subunit
MLCPKARLIRCFDLQVSPASEYYQIAMSLRAYIPGFCKSATTKEVATHGYVLTPGRYVGAEELEDDGESFEDLHRRNRLHRLAALRGVLRMHPRCI